MPRRILAAGMLFLGAALPIAGPLRADEAAAPIVLPGESNRTAHRLAEADKLAAAQRWAEAIDEYQHILEETPDDLVPSPDRQQCLAARRLCHLRLAALPAPALALYRQRVDGQTEKWLHEGEATHDPRWLQRIVDEAFCSRVGDRALDLLGDLAFERGDFTAAESWWRMATRPASESAATSGKQETGPSLELVYPDPQVDLAQVRAKQILSRLFRGERDGFQEALSAFRALHGKAEGHFAGRQGNYADILQAMAGSSDLLAPPDEETWTTFAGSPSRNLVPARGPGRWQWKVRLDGSPWPRSLVYEVGQWKPASPSAIVGSPALPFYPVIVGDQVLVADLRCVLAFDLKTGQRSIWYDLMQDRAHGDPNLSMNLPVPPDLSCTLTVAGDRIYVRLGAVALAPWKDGARAGEINNFLVCLNLKPDPTGNRRRWLVQLPLEDKPGETVFFEGAPVVSDGRVHVAMTRFAGGAMTTSIACYDASTGATRWRQPVPVCETRDVKEISPRYRHHLLTLAGPNVVFCSHSGGIIAVEAATGRRSWAVRYPSRGVLTAEGNPSPRDLAPCVFAGGRLFAAPADCDRILCLDPETGRLLWKSDSPVEVVHLLGVGAGKVVFTTPDGIRAVDAANGASLRGWMQPNDGSSRLPPGGRGFLAGGLVFWPTREGLRVLRLEDGEPAEDWYDVMALQDPQGNRLRLGNLAFANGCLVAANETEIAAFVPESFFLAERRQEAAAHPDSPQARYRLALAEAEAGLFSQAVQDFEEAARESPQEDVENVIGELALRDKHRLLLDQASAAQASKKWDEAAAFLTQAAGREMTTSMRLRALSRQADLWKKAGKPERSLAVWQSILEDGVFRCGRIEADGLSYLAADWANWQVDELIRAYGASLYDPVEQRARLLLATAAGEHRPEVLEHLVQHFPNATVTGPALRELAAFYEQANRQGEAARAYRQAWLRSSAGTDRAAALAGLAQLQERRQCWEAARMTWQKLARDAGTSILPQLDPAHPVHEFVAARLHKPEYDSSGSTSRSNPDQPPLPWELPLGRGEQMLVPAETGGEVASLFFLRGSDLVCREAASGKPRWTRALPRRPSWLGRYGNAVLVAEAGGVHSLSLADGTILWELSVADGQCDVRRPNPDSTRPSSQLGSFHLAGSRLFFLQDERRLLAVDCESGRLLWSQWAPGGRIYPEYPGGLFGSYYHAGENRIAIQTTAGNLWVLDSLTGRRVHQLPTSKDPWPRPPLALEEGRLGAVTDLSQVSLFDLAGGKEIWTRSTPKPTISGEAPQLLGTSRTLLLLTDGWQLERLNAMTGEPQWSCAISNQPVAVESIALDQEAVYFVSRNILHARSLASGRPMWQVPLMVSAAPWQMVLRDSRLIVFPSKVPMELNRPWLTGAYLIGFPWEMEWRDLPVWIYRADTGRLERRLTLKGQGPLPSVQVVDRGVVVGLPGKALPLPMRSGGKDEQ